VAHLLCRDRHDPGRAGERDARDDECGYVPEAARVSRYRGQDDQRRYSDEPDPLKT
jgi:hypothetical protein